MKTPEEIRVAVIAECERLCPNVEDIFEIAGRLLFLEREGYGFTINMAFEKGVSIDIVYVPLTDSTDWSIEWAYRLLGLEARDERERATKLVKVLEEIDHICFEVAENPDYTFADNDAELLHGIASRGIEDYKKGEQS